MKPTPTPSKPRRPELHQRFIDFLKEENALIPYCCNIANDEDTKTLTLSKVLNKSRFDNHVNKFFWEGTSEGGLYWHNMHIKWIKKCNSM